MSLSPTTIAFGLLSATVVMLLFVTQCQRNLIEARDAALDASHEREQALTEQLDMSQATLEAERRRIIEIARRLDQAITEYTEGATTAHENHETRMEELIHMESPEAVDWMCKPVPDDIRRLFGDTETDRSDGDDTP